MSESNTDNEAIVEGMLQSRNRYFVTLTQLGNQTIQALSTMLDLGRSNEDLFRSIMLPLNDPAPSVTVTTLYENLRVFAAAQTFTSLPMPVRQKVSQNGIPTIFDVKERHSNEDPGHFAIYFIAAVWRDGLILINDCSPAELHMQYESDE
eukprot:CAMPEP_0119311512 /NCGR_PEP_ID=MMETSP1333-20130426/22702_1 /TAXON_ID=418940 /ORGANISM="Scyphosphaera apsteinii, Strain RCC1455" /LENGTH=149 /DNA_ID=CAMNT_0007315905 /DNA_START=22 /DNA_END=468 /DNA_ORIENTATION=+